MIKIIHAMIIRAKTGLKAVHLGNRATPAKLACVAGGSGCARETFCGEAANPYRIVVKQSCFLECSYFHSVC